MVERPGTVKLRGMQKALGGGKARVAARRNGETVHLDEIDLATRRARKRFAQGACEKLPAATPGDRGRTAAAGGRTAGGERSRPDRPSWNCRASPAPSNFTSPKSPGLAVPVVFVDGGKPAGRWRLSPRSAGGRRKVRELSSPVDLSGGGELWTSPRPRQSRPSPRRRAGRRRRGELGSAGPPRRTRPSCPAAVRARRLLHRPPPDTSVAATAIAVLWVMLTYGYQAWGAVPYLYVGGPVGSGKSAV